MTNESEIGFRLVSSRQLRAARVLAGLTQAQLSAAAGFHPRACKYWEHWGDAMPSTHPETLDAIEAALARHGVELFANPSPGCRLVATK
jgi:hypothetical protein